jgi:hypothetical protein
MSQPQNLFDTYDSTGIREDLSNIIYDVDPTATPFYTKCSKATASNTFFEWQTQNLRNSTPDNQHIEGDNTTAQAVIPTVRLGAYTQIFKNAVVISDTDNAPAIDNAGRAREMSYQTLLIAKEQKLDIEASLFANKGNVSGSNVLARQTGGVDSWLITNVDFNSAGGGANPTGDGTDARVDGTQRAFTQDQFDEVMQETWVSGGKANTCYLSAFQMNAALSFVGNNNQRANVSGESEKVINSMAVYLTPWGSISFVPSRENRSRDVFIMQDDMWSVHVLRPTKNVELAKTGDSTMRQVVTELGLCSKNEQASGAVFDLTTS